MYNIEREEKERERETDRQTEDRQTNRQTERQRETERDTERDREKTQLLLPFPHGKLTKFFFATEYDLFVLLSFFSLSSFRLFFCFAF